jgi:hypothetical protein
MKLIYKIISDHPEVKDHPDVVKLIDYIDNLEESKIKKEQDLKFNKELLYLELLREIYKDILFQIEQDELSIRFKETNRVDFKECLIYLKKYLDKFQEENKVNLNR